jgi:hypothetical protein
MRVLSGYQKWKLLIKTIFWYWLLPIGTQYIIWWFNLIFVKIWWLVKSTNTICFSHCAKSCQENTSSNYLMKQNKLKLIEKLKLNLWKMLDNYPYICNVVLTYYPKRTRNKSVSQCWVVKNNNCWMNLFVISY